MIVYFTNQSISFVYSFYKIAQTHQVCKHSYVVRYSSINQSINQYSFIWCKGQNCKNTIEIYKEGL